MKKKQQTHEDQTQTTKNKPKQHERETIKPLGSD